VSLFYAISLLLELLELGVALACSKLSLDLGNEAIGLGVVLEVHVVEGGQEAQAQLATSRGADGGAHTAAKARLGLKAVTPAVSGREDDLTAITTVAVLLALIAAFEAHLAPALVAARAALEPAATARHVAGAEQTATILGAPVARLAVLALLNELVGAIIPRHHANVIASLVGARVASKALHAAVAEVGLGLVVDHTVLGENQKARASHRLTSLGGMREA